jgi:F-type H+-transporting ATPase subunit b
MPGIVTPLAQSSAAQSAQDQSSNFLVSPNLGLMIWTLIAFFAALFILRKYAWPAITEALEKRQRAIEESIEAAERARAEAAELKEARAQAEEILARARKAAEVREREALEAAKGRRDELLEQTRRDIEAETRRAIGEIRKEVADLTILATEKVTRKALDEDDQRRLVEEALGELDFSQLGGEHRN